MSKTWSKQELAQAKTVWADRTDEQLAAALDKGVRLTQATDAQIATFAAMNVDLSAFPQKAYATAKDIDRIYLASTGPSTSDAGVKELVRKLKDEHGMNANQVAALVGIPPRFINGVCMAGRKLAEAAAAEAAKAEAQQAS